VESVREGGRDAWSHVRCVLEPDAADGAAFATAESRHDGVQYIDEGVQDGYPPDL
jgi:hypothetical protein